MATVRPDARDLQHLKSKLASGKKQPARALVPRRESRGVGMHHCGQLHGPYSTHKHTQHVKQYLSLMRSGAWGKRRRGGIAGGCCHGTTTAQTPADSVRPTTCFCSCHPPEPLKCLKSRPCTPLGGCRGRAALTCRRTVPCHQTPAGPCRWASCPAAPPHSLLDLFNALSVLHAANLGCGVRCDNTKQSMPSHAQISNVQLLRVSCKLH